MMHTYRELYHIGGKGYYTEDYLIANNIPMGKHYSDEGKACRCVSIGTDKGTKNIITANGKRTVYTYGEKTWFDTEAERDEYRTQRNVERAEETKRNKMLKAIMEHYKTLSTEELEKLVATL